MTSEIERDLILDILDIFERSVAIFRPYPVPYWKADFHDYQQWARGQRLFAIEGGILSSPPDGSTAGDRKAFSRLRLGLEKQGLITITRISETSRSICLTLAGLALAEKLTGQQTPADLRKAIKAMEPKQTPRDPRLVKLARALRKVTKAEGQPR
ncbi:MAG: hypothetical protein SH850_01750 [Planctomycetaceae bacterium]|nr:hypothetical protein [Planctomycetaceae bacterium]